MCFLLEMFARARQFLQQPRLHVQNQQSWLLIHPHNSEQRIIAPPQDPLALGFSCSPNSSNANCVLTKFNFVNNSDSSGYFSLCSGNHKRLKESIIAIKSTGILRWVWSTAQVSIEGSFIVLLGAIDGGGKITLTAGTTTTASDSTHTPFLSSPDHQECQRSSKGYSMKIVTRSGIMLGFAFVSAATIIGLVF